MCTVTFLPLPNNDFIFTSNRDETPLRKTILPKTYIEDDVELMYPKDELAGGTWIGTSRRKRVVCVLNGGFENHVRKPPYKMSRGVVVKKILVAKNAIDTIQAIDFIGVEPFTLIFINWEQELEIYELVWDGYQKHFSKLKNEPKIWSSSTLYTEQMKDERKKWFANWLQENKKYTQSDILDFHQNEDLGNKETSLKMKRKFVETVSITSILKSNDSLKMKYIDFLN